MSNQKMEDVTPDALMQRFQGIGLKKIILFTVIVHVIVLLGSSVPFLVKTVLGADARKMSEEERITAAVQKATEAIRKIAGDYDLNPQDISERFSGGGSRAAAASSVSAPEATEPVEDVPVAAERPKSEIEKQLEVRKEGPAIPQLEDDIF